MTTTGKLTMKNFDNSLRSYNKQVLLRSRMHTYTKKYIDNLVHKAVFCKCTVPINILSEEDIEKMKKSLVKPKEKKSKSDEPAKKKQKIDTTGVDVLKMVLSREGESDKFKSKFKTALKPSVEITASTSNQDVHVPMEVDSVTEITAITTPTKTINIVGTIWCRDFRTLIDEHKITSYLVNFLNIKPKHPVNGIKKPVLSVKPSSSAIRQSVNAVKPPSTHKHTVNGHRPSSSGPRLTAEKPRHHPNGKNLSTKGNLHETEYLYSKYFSKTVQDTIVTIANILNIISMSNKHHKARMDESFKKKSEAEKLKERCDANRLHDKHKRILEAKLKKYFSIVVTNFEDSEFDPTFRMFFLSILTVLRVLDQPRFKKGSIFKNLVLLLWNSLKNSEYDNPKVYAMFRSKKFRPDCIDLIGLIEDSRDNDPGVTDRMTLFFVSTVNSREYFQAVIDAVTSDSTEDLGILIDNASMQCGINSKFVNPVAVYRSSPDITPVSNETVQQWMLQNQNNTAGNIPIHVQNGYRPQTNGFSSAEHSFVTNFYETFSNSLQKKVSSDSSTAKGIPAKKCVVVRPSTSSTSNLIQATASETSTLTTTTAGTLLTFKPSSQNKLLPGTSNHLNTTDNTIFVGNKQYQLVKGSTGQIKALVNGKQIMTVKSPPTITIKCFAKGCNSVATIMCSNCTTVKYCSHNCQRLDWYDNHIHNCGRLLTMKQPRQT